MTEKELMGLLLGAHRAQVQDIQKERAGCLSLLRARQVALNPQAATPEEKEEISRCRHCARLVEQMRAGLVHPPLWAVVRWLAGLLSEPEVRLMRSHLEEDGCCQCNRLARSSLLNALATALQGANGATEQVKALVEAGGSAFASLPVPRGAFDPKTQSPHLAFGEHPASKLTVTVRETEDGNVVGSVSQPGEALAGRVVRVELVGEKGTRFGEVVLQRQGTLGCAGSHNFGPLAEVTRVLGQDYAALALLTPVGGVKWIVTRGQEKP